MDNFETEPTHVRKRLLSFVLPLSLLFMKEQGLGVTALFFALHVLLWLKLHVFTTCIYYMYLLHVYMYSLHVYMYSLHVYTHVLTTMVHVLTTSTLQSYKILVYVPGRAHNVLLHVQIDLSLSI
jgi:hypothetical protein